MRRVGDETRTPGRQGARDASPGLRLAGHVDAGPRAPLRGDDASSRPARVRADREAHRAWEVSAENRASSGMTVSDARWVLAVRAADAIEGGRAAVLRPEVRQRLTSTGVALGLRPFDANLVLAIVQDAARRGQTTQHPETVDSLLLVPGVAPREGGGRRAFWTALLLGCSVVWAAALVWWLLG